MAGARPCWSCRDGGRLTFALLRLRHRSYLLSVLHAGLVVGGVSISRRAPAMLIGSLDLHLQTRRGWRAGPSQWGRCLRIRLRCEASLLVDVDVAMCELTKLEKRRIVFLDR